MIYQQERPYNFDTVVGQRFIVDQLRQQSIHNIWLGQYIFAGKFGSGKTTMARIIRMAANCQHKDGHGNPCMECEACRAVLKGTPDILEIDAASNTGVDNIRELKEYAACRPMKLSKKVVIIDEVHKLSSAAFDALLKLLEEPPEYIIFILCTTALDAIPATVQSRCAVYRFGAIDEEDIEKHVLHVAEKQGISITEDAASVIAQHSEGAMRNALKYLEQLGGARKQVDAELCRSILGLSDARKIFEYLSCMMDGDYEKLIKLVDETSIAGKDFLTLARDISTACADCIVLKCSKDSKIRGEQQYVNACKEIVGRYELGELCKMSELALELLQSAKQEASKSQFLAHAFALMQKLTTSTTSLKQERSAAISKDDQVKESLSQKIFMQALMDRFETLAKEVEMLKSCSFISTEEHAEKAEVPPARTPAMYAPRESGDVPKEEDEMKEAGFEPANTSVFDENLEAEIPESSGLMDDEDLDADPFSDFFDSEDDNPKRDIVPPEESEKASTKEPCEPESEETENIDLIPVPDGLILSDRARQARERLLCAIHKEQPMEKFFENCEETFTEEGILVIVASQPALNRLLLFLGSHQVKDVSVQLKSA